MGTGTRNFGATRMAMLLCGTTSLLAALGFALSPPTSPGGGHDVPTRGAPPSIGAPDEDGPAFFIGPVPGLTSTWHPAPVQTSMPLGTLGHFKVAAAEAATVSWEGAIEVSRDAQWSFAVCPLLVAGPASVKVEVVGTDVLTASCDLSVVAVDPDDIHVPAILVDTSPTVIIDETWSQEELNDATVGLYFGPSIAAVTKTGPGACSTSTARPMRFSLGRVEPPGFAPLIEWRIDGVPAARLGPATIEVFSQPGTHLVEAGPLDAPSSLSVEAYRVSIISPPEGTALPDDVPIVFTAATEPPGHEASITWLAATKFGSASPVVGSGPVFVTTFSDTFGVAPDGGDWQWLGVKADNATMGQDQKMSVIAIGMVFDPEDTIGPAVILDLWDSANAGIIGKGDRILQYRGFSVSSGSQLMSLILSLDDVAPGEVVPMVIIPWGDTVPVAVNPVAQEKPKLEEKTISETYSNAKCVEIDLNGDSINDACNCVAGSRTCVLSTTVSFDATTCKVKKAKITCSENGTEKCKFETPKAK